MESCLQQSVINREFCTARKRTVFNKSVPKIALIREYYIQNTNIIPIQNYLDVILKISVHLTACAYPIITYLDSLVLSSAALSCTRQHEKEIRGRISYWCGEKSF
jgi:hypothetical protein